MESQLSTTGVNLPRLKSREIHGNRYRYTATDSVGSYSAAQTASTSDPLDLTFTNSYRAHDVTIGKASS